MFNIKDYVSTKNYKSCKEIDDCVNQRLFLKVLTIPSLIQYLHVNFFDEDVIQSYVPILLFLNQCNNDLNLKLSTMKKIFENINQFMLSYFFFFFHQYGYR